MQGQGSIETSVVMTGQTVQNRLNRGDCGRCVSAHDAEHERSRTIRTVRLLITAHLDGAVSRYYRFESSREPDRLTHLNGLIRHDAIGSKIACTLSQLPGQHFSRLPRPAEWVELAVGCDIERRGFWEARSSRECAVKPHP